MPPEKPPVAQGNTGGGVRVKRGFVFPIRPSPLSNREDDQAMRASGPCADIVIEIELEIRIAFETITGHVEDVDLQVAFGIDHTTWGEVFDEEIV